MAEDKEEKKDIKSGAESSASSSSAKNSATKHKLNSLSEKFTKVTSTPPAPKHTTSRVDIITQAENEIKQEEGLKGRSSRPQVEAKPEVKPSVKPTPTVTPTATPTNPSNPKHEINLDDVEDVKPKQKIDKKKIERIKKELMADDEPTLEEKNKALQDKQGSTKEEIGYRDKDGNLIGRAERISRKNEQLMEDVYRYSRQRTKDIVDLRRQIITIVITVGLVLLLIAVIALGVMMYIRQSTVYEEQYIRVSVSMTNKEIFYDTEVNGELIPKDVSPGDRFNLNIVARNSNSIAGDTDIDDWLTIYVRFKIVLIVNGVEYNDYIYIEPDPEVWERYDANLEAGYLNSTNDPTPVVKEDDGYYYCKLVLWPNDKVTVIDWLRFSETKITEVIGGNDAVLRVDIEALEAIPSIVKNREIWNNAPQHWVEYITNTFPDTGEHEEEADTGVETWWVILFASVSVILIVAIIIVSTKRKKKKELKLTNFNPTNRRR